MALQVYSIGEIIIDGVQAMQEASMTISRKTNSQAVLTVALGYAGESPGAPMCEVHVTSAVPLAGFDVAEQGMKMGNKGGGAQAGLQSVTFQVIVAGQSLIFKGFIIEDDFSHAVNSEAKLSFKARGEFALWA